MNPIVVGAEKLPPSVTGRMRLPGYLLRRRTCEEMDRKAWLSDDGLEEKMKVPWGWLE